MASNKRSVYFGPPLLELVANISSLDSVSGRINKVAERYSLMVNQLTVSPLLSKSETEYLRKILSRIEPLTIEKIKTLDSLLREAVVENLELTRFKCKRSAFEKFSKLDIPQRIAFIDSLGF